MQTRYVKAGGRFLTTAEFMAAFNKAHPQAHMNKSNIAAVRTFQLCNTGMRLLAPGRLLVRGVSPVTTLAQ